MVHKLKHLLSCSPQRLCLNGAQTLTLDNYISQKLPIAQYLYKLISVDCNSTHLLNISLSVRLFGLGHGIMLDGAKSIHALLLPFPASSHTYNPTTLVKSTNLMMFV